MKSEIFDCQKAKSVDLVDYLQHLGYLPRMIRNGDYWYLSPSRNERSASFKVSRKSNIWFDHGEGIGGTIIDFGIRYYRCSIGNFLTKLEDETSLIFPLAINSGQKASDHIRKILITDIRSISDPCLRQYLDQRNIPLQIANQFCSEIEFELYGKKRLAIGFKNDAGGFELRNDAFKGSSHPKSITSVKNHPEKVSVFEGFFDFLSFQTRLLSNREFIHCPPKNQDSYIILNSLAFFAKQRSLFEKYQHIELYLDRDKAGLRITKEALGWSERYRDKSYLYDGFKDLNEFHVSSRKMDLIESKAYKHRL